MKRNLTQYNNLKSGLYIISTPIGNIDDIRGLEIFLKTICTYTVKNRDPHTDRNDLCTDRQRHNPHTDRKDPCVNGIKTTKNFPIVNLFFHFKL